jgi:hypothetical protein
MSFGCFFCPEALLLDIQMIQCNSVLDGLNRCVKGGMFEKTKNMRSPLFLIYRQNYSTYTNLSMYCVLLHGQIKAPFSYISMFTFFKGHKCKVGTQILRIQTGMQTAILQDCKTAHYQLGHTVSRVSTIYYFVQYFMLKRNCAL